MIAAFTSSPHRRAHLASVLLAAVVVGLAGLGLAAVVDLASRATMLEERRFELRSLVKRLEARGPGAARAQQTLAADPFLPGATPTLAANALQRRIVATAEETGVVLRTIGVETAPGTDPGELPRVTLQASAAARIGALQALLYRIETESPFVLVDEVTIRAPQGDTAGRDPELDVELRLIGYLRRKEG
jgi:hypothetical protein